MFILDEDRIEEVRIITVGHLPHLKFLEQRLELFGELRLELVQLYGCLGEVEGLEKEGE